jgi:hypothetical protein
LLGCYSTCRQELAGTAAAQLHACCTGALSVLSQSRKWFLMLFVCCCCRQAVPAACANWASASNWRVPQRHCMMLTTTCLSMHRACFCLHASHVASKVTQGRALVEPHRTWADVLSRRLHMHAALLRRGCSAICSALLLITYVNTMFASFASMQRHYCTLGRHAAACSALLLTPHASVCSAVWSPQAAACNNVKVDGVETDVDCGGSECSACAAGKRCNNAFDCRSLNCVLMHAAPGIGYTCTCPVGSMVSRGSQQ